MRPNEFIDLCKSIGPPHTATLGDVAIDCYHKVGDGIAFVLRIRGGMFPSDWERIVRSGEQRIVTVPLKRVAWIGDARNPATFDITYRRFKRVWNAVWYLLTRNTPTIRQALQSRAAQLAEKPCDTSTSTPSRRTSAASTCG